MLPLLNYKGKKLFYVADLIPTVGHIPIPYVMWYDTRRLLTLADNSSFLQHAYLEAALLLLVHAPHHELVSLIQTEKGIRIDANFSFDSYFNS